MKRCPTCARPASDDLTFCVDDGAALEATGVETFADLATREGRVPVERALRLARSLCDAWSPARTGGRPPPPMVPLEVEVGAGDRVSVTFAHDAAPAAVDARELDPAAPYAAPETFPGGGAVTEAASVYHVAALVHHLLTGSAPFDGSTTAAVAVRKLLEDPPSARAVRPDVPASLDAALLRALDRDPARRFATVSDFAAALAAVSPEAPSPASPAAFAPSGASPAPAFAAPAMAPAAPAMAHAPPLAAAPSPKPSRGLFAAGGALVVVALVAGLSLTLTRGQHDAAPPMTTHPGAPELRTARRESQGSLAPPAQASAPPTAAPIAPAMAPTPPPAAPAVGAITPQRPQRPSYRTGSDRSARPSGGERARPSRARLPMARSNAGELGLDAPMLGTGNVPGVSSSDPGPGPSVQDPPAPRGTPRTRPRPRPAARPAPVVEPAPPAAPAPAQGEGAPAAQTTPPPTTPPPAIQPPEPARTTAPTPAPPVVAPPQPSEEPSSLPLVLALGAGFVGLLLVGIGLLLRRRGASVPVVPPPAQMPPAQMPPAQMPPAQTPPAPAPARPAHIPATAVVPMDGAATVPDAPVWQGTSPDALAKTLAAAPLQSGVWCARCGTPVPSEARFCPTDGADLRTHGTTVDPNASRPTTGTQPDMKPFAVGRYRCESRLGEGGMGVVYRASDVETGTTCAVKVLLVRGRAEGPLAERFRKEARLAAAVRHPNCVTIYDYGEVAGQLFYLAMELVDGRSLDEALDGRAMPPTRVAAIVGQVCAALEAAHGAGIVHRDLKPQNVMVRDGDVVKLVDFGIARDLNAAKTTLAGVVVGTPAYMAPEQARAEAGVDGRADVFSVGVMTWELLTGRLPYEPAGNAIQQVVARATLRSAVPPTGVSGAVDAALARATEPDPSRRTPDVRTLAAELGAALQSAAA